MLKQVRLWSVDPIIFLYMLKEYSVKYKQWVGWGLTVALLWCETHTATATIL